VVDLIVIQAITELRLEGQPPEGIQLDDDCIIRPLDERIRFLSQNIFHPFIGLIHHESIINASAANFLEQVSETPVDDEASKGFLLRTMTWTQLFLLSLWLIKDNSGNVGDGHLLLAEVGKGVHGFWSQRPGVLNFTADCHRLPSTFSKAEIDEAVALFARLKAVLPQGPYNLDEPRPSGLVFDSRVVRTVYFAQAARASADVAVKVAFQCLCFESLFASSSDSISHRVSERTAALIGLDGPDKRSVYTGMRKLYNARSTVVHGDPIKVSALPALRERAKQADSYLRRAIRKLLEMEELLTLFSSRKHEAIDAYFLMQIFPGNAPTPPAAGTGTTTRAS